MKIERRPAETISLSLQKAYTTNIAAVPHYSPFRYPGGKTWLTPLIRKWLAIQPAKVLYEPFAGGASASLLAVIEGYVDRAVLVEKDVGVAAVWRIALSNNAERLIDKILHTKITHKEVCRILSSTPHNLLSLAFQTIVKNRCRRGGILASGAGLLIKGERNNGLASRWYPETLAMRIRLINSIRDHVEIHCGDGIRMLNAVERRRTRIKLFVDPPYPKLMQPGIRPLYNHCNLDHQLVFEVLAGARHDFLLTYSDCPDVRKWAKQAQFTCAAISMRNSNAKRELLITRAEERALFKQL